MRKVNLADWLILVGAICGTAVVAYSYFVLQ
jgi:hypothetical protein